MPDVNWETFRALPGSDNDNFEMLCRALVIRNYAQFGRFAARAAQPGIEFHVNVNRACSLGEVGRWWGWQCRWYDLPGGTRIGTARRRKIVEAIRKTQGILPEMTDWVLWTRHALTAGDQEWFYGLDTPMELRLWTGAEVESHLCGEAEVLRKTYFGELILTPPLMSDLHSGAVASIRNRWMPEVHRPVDAERSIRAMLGELGSWREIVELAERIALASDYLVSVGDVPDGFEDQVEDLATRLSDTEGLLRLVHSQLEQGDLEQLFDLVGSRPTYPAYGLRLLARRMRGTGDLLALQVANAVADIVIANGLLVDLVEALGISLVSVLADAGCGKTQLAAELTSPVEDGSAGLLLHGRDLHAINSLDDLAKRVVIGGEPVPSFIALLEAMDAAGRRSKARLPLVIDGLNESEDPRSWKASLAPLPEIMVRYPYVLLVVTLRGEFKEEALPEHVHELEIPDFEGDTFSAVSAYFKYFKIDAMDVELPIYLLRHPLTLRIFCEVANPSRNEIVGVEVMPCSLTSLFDRYLSQCAERIADLSPVTRRLYPEDVARALGVIGEQLWDQGSRVLELEELRTSLGDDNVPWDQSIVNAMEQNGILLRTPGGRGGVTPVYDTLAGHIVADALINRIGSLGMADWLSDDNVVQTLFGDYSVRHPFAADIFNALAGLMPRRLGNQQLWKIAPDSAKARALRLASELEGRYVDEETKESLRSLVIENSQGQFDLLNRLKQTRGADEHPLNAEFLNYCMRDMDVGSRDMRWTEWLRRNSRQLVDDLQVLEARWGQGVSHRGDRLRALWVLWTLTSTVRDLRDHSTRTLYWFGRTAPRHLFELAAMSLELNDCYIAERMMAACYGVVMANQRPEQDFRDDLAWLLNELEGRLFGDTATYPTSHGMIRLYVRGIAEFSTRFCPEIVPESMAEGDFVFSPGEEIESIRPDDSRYDEIRNTLRMDFKNYTIGSLFRDRGAYNDSHEGYQDAVANVFGMVWKLGWREDGLGAVDRGLGESFSPHGEDYNTERYGKKYGWIGYYTYAGVLESQGLQQEPWSRMIDIDPSFPEPPVHEDAVELDWLAPDTEDTREWILHGRVELPANYIRREMVQGQPGPWVAVHSFLRALDAVLGRHVIGHLTALVVGPDKEKDLCRALDEAGCREGRLPDLPRDIYTFSGEIPWGSEFCFIREGGALLTEYIDDAVFAGTTIESVEVLGHGFGWESHHSVVNKAGESIVPAKTFSEKFGLVSLPQVFHQVSEDGRLASATVGAPSGFEGVTLYLREDLLLSYIGERKLVWFASGERLVHPYPMNLPEWLVRARQAGDDCWKLVKALDDLE